MALEIIIMKNILTLLFAFTLLCMASCGDKNSYELSVTIKDLPDQSKVLLKYIDTTNNPITVDSTITIAGAATLKGVQNIPDMHYLFFENANGSIPVIIEKGKITVKAQKDSLNHAVVGGSDQNKWFSIFQETSRGFSQQAKGISKDLQQARASGKKAFEASLKEEYMELQEEAKQYEVTFAKQYPASLISVLLLERMYVYKSVTEDILKPIIESLTPEVKETIAGKRLTAAWEANLMTAIGSKALDFSGPNPNGEILSLSQIKGKVTIIDFWAAWCKPCRAENPNVVQVYKQYHDRGLEIISISLDKKKEDWLAAIETDQMDWHHISTLSYFNDPIAKQYNIKAIPATLILDENGIIVAKNLRGPALGNQLAKMLP